MAQTQKTRAADPALATAATILRAREILESADVVSDGSTPVLLANIRRLREATRVIEAALTDLLVEARQPVYYAHEEFAGQRRATFEQIGEAWGSNDDGDVPLARNNVPRLLKRNGLS